MAKLVLERDAKTGQDVKSHSSMKDRQKLEREKPEKWKSSVEIGNFSAK
jgi:hypothetical protein